MFWPKHIFYEKVSFFEYFIRLIWQKRNIFWCDQSPISSDLVEKLRKLRESLGAVDVANHQLFVFLLCIFFSSQDVIWLYDCLNKQYFRLSGNLDRLAIRIKNFLTETFNKYVYLEFKIFWSLMFSFQFFFLMTTRKFDDTKIVDRLQRLQAAADAEDKNVKTTRSCLELESFL